MSIVFNSDNSNKKNFKKCLNETVLLTLKLNVILNKLILNYLILAVFPKSVS